MSLPVWNSEAVGNIIKQKDEINKKDDDPMAGIPVWKRELLKRKQAQASRTFPVSSENSKDNNFGNSRYSRYDSLSSYTSNDLNVLPIIGSMSLATPSSSSASSLNEEYIEPKETSSKSGLTLINLEENPWIKAERQLGFKSSQGFRQKFDDHKSKTAEKRFSAGSATLVSNVNKDYVDREKDLINSSDNKMKNFISEEPDYEIYGPGIVNKLKYKYISLTLAAESGDSYVKLKRSSSLENLLESKWENSNDKNYQTNSLHRRSSKKGLASKKSFSVENLFDGLIGDSKKTRGDPLSLLANENVVIIEAGNKRKSSVDNAKAEVFSPVNADSGLALKFSGSKEMLLEELPKPNTVQTYKNIFESSLEKEKQKAKSVKKRISTSEGKSTEKLKISAKKDIYRPPTPKKEVEAKISRVKSPPSDSVAFEPQVAAAQAAFDVKLKSVTVTKIKDASRRSVTHSHIEEPVKSFLNSFSESKSELINVNNERNKRNVTNKHHTETCDENTDSNISVIAQSNGTIVPKKESDTIIEIQPDPILKNLNQKLEPLPREVKEKAILPSDTNAFEKVNAKEEIIKDKKDSGSSKSSQELTATFHVKRRAPSPPGTTVILEMRNGTVQTNSSIPGMVDAATTLSNNNHNIQLNKLHDNPVTNIDDLLPNIDGGGNRYSNLTIVDDYTYENGDCVYRIPDPCGIVFEGENIVLEKSNLLKNKNKNLKLQFDDDAISMYEYPSEDCMAEEYDEIYGPEKVDTEVNPQSSSRLKTNPALSSSGGNLSSYTPSSLMSEGFELGVEPTWESLPVTVKQNEEPPADEFLIKPGEEADMHTWSTSNSMDLLF